MSRRITLLLIVCLLSITHQTFAQSALTTTPNDPQFKGQWVVDRIGLQCAWEHTTGSPDVTVAVIDSGVDMKHPDLVNALRDDGYDTVSEDNDPSDENGHGTNVAGIIAATINNNEGIAGVAGGGTKILPIRVMSADGGGTNDDIVEGIRYAVSKKVQIINMSLGSLLPLNSEDIVAAIKDAHDAGVLVIVAAGNSFVPLPNFAFGVEEYAVVVAATDPEDRKTNFSNYGAWIAVSAPGYEILSTMPTYDVFLTSDAMPPEERFKRNYDTMSGTSQATPVVAGVAALIFAAHPDWSADQVREALQSTATDISAQNPTKKAGPITYFEPSNLGAGRVNACDALGGPLTKNTPVGSGNVAGGGSKLNPWLLGGIGLGVLVLLLLLFFLLRRRKKVQPAPAGPQGGFNNPYQQPMPPQGQYQQPMPPQGQYQQPMPPQGQYQQPPQGQYQPPSQGQYQPPAQQQRPPTPVPAYNSPPESFAPPSRPDVTINNPPVQEPVKPATPATPPPPARTPMQEHTIVGSMAPTWGKLSVLQGGNGINFFVLRESSAVIGRESGTTIMLSNDPTVSRRHAIIRHTDRGAEIEDLGSSHGTKLNGQPITQTTRLRSGDVIEIGMTSMRFDG